MNNRFIFITATIVALTASAQTRADEGAFQKRFRVGERWIQFPKS